MPQIIGEMTRQIRQTITASNDIDCSKSLISFTYSMESFRFLLNILPQTFCSHATDMRPMARPQTARLLRSMFTALLKLGQQKAMLFRKGLPQIVSKKRRVPLNVGRLCSQKAPEHHVHKNGTRSMPIPRLYVR